MIIYKDYFTSNNIIELLNYLNIKLIENNFDDSRLFSENRNVAYTSYDHFENPKLLVKTMNLLIRKLLGRSPDRFFTANLVVENGLQLELICRSLALRKIINEYRFNEGIVLCCGFSNYLSFQLLSSLKSRKDHLIYVPTINDIKFALYAIFNFLRASFYIASHILRKEKEVLFKECVTIVHIGSMSERVLLKYKKILYPLLKPNYLILSSSFSGPSSKSKSFDFHILDFLCLSDLIKSKNFLIKSFLDYIKRLLIRKSFKFSEFIYFIYYLYSHAYLNYLCDMAFNNINLSANKISSYVAWVEYFSAEMIASNSLNNITRISTNLHNWPLEMEDPFLKWRLAMQDQLSASKVNFIDLYKINNISRNMVPIAGDKFTILYDLGICLLGYKDVDGYLFDFQFIKKISEEFPNCKIFIRPHISYWSKGGSLKNISLYFNNKNIILHHKNDSLENIIQESDLLITRYSSLAYDYLLLNKNLITIKSQYYTHGRNLDSISNPIYSINEGIKYIKSIIKNSN